MSSTTVCVIRSSRPCCKTTSKSVGKLQWLEAGLRYRLDDKTQLYLDARWQEWSKFREDELSFRNDRVVVSDRDWEDTWHMGTAAVRVVSPKSLVSVGFSYENSSVTDEYRTLDFPVDEQWKLSAAYGWQHSESMYFSLGGTLSFVGNAALEQTAQRVTVRGDYDTNFLAIVGGTLRYEFWAHDVTGMTCLTTAGGEEVVFDPADILRCVHYHPPVAGSSRHGPLAAANRLLGANPCFFVFNGSFEALSGHWSARYQR